MFRSSSSTSAIEVHVLVPFCGVYCVERVICMYRSDGGTAEDIQCKIRGHSSTRDTDNNTRRSIVGASR